MSPSKDSLISFRRVSGGVNRRTLKGFAGLLQEELAGDREFHVRIADDLELRRLNKRFRGKNVATDVLSFPADDADFLGDIAISWERAAAQARQFRHSLDAELQILMLHGLLHLLGMDHERDRGKMARAEADWRARLALPSGLIERARA